MLKKPLTGVALAALLLPIAATARTSTGDVLVTGEYRGEVRSMSVAVSDLDLRHDRAVHRAESRIRYAVKQVCDINRERELYEKRDYKACYDPAMDSARNDLDQRIAIARATAPQPPSGGPGGIGKRERGPLPQGEDADLGALATGSSR